MKKNWTLAIACLGLCIGLVSKVHGAPLVVTNCAVPPWSNSSVSFNDTTTDLTLQCAITASSVNIRAHSITVDGPSGGAITTSGTGGMKLSAYMNTSSNPGCLSPEDLTGGINVTSANLQDNNTNGGITLRACGNININEAPGFPKPSISAGNSTQFEASCYGTQCKIVASEGIFNGNQIVWTSDGDMDIQDSTFYSTGGRPLQKFYALHGNIFAGGCDTNSPLPTNQQLTIGDACKLCQLCHGHNAFGGTVESTFFAFAEKTIDFSGVCLRIAETITIFADQRNPDGTNYGNVLGDVGIKLDGGEIRNDFGKTGVIRITSHPALNKLGKPFHPDKGNDYSDFLFGDGYISIDDTVLINDGKQGGAVDPKAVAVMNSGSAVVPGNCAANTLLHCSAPFGGDAIPQRGWVADQGAPNGRISFHVIGIPRCDS